MSKYKIYVCFCASTPKGGSNGNALDVVPHANHGSVLGFKFFNECISALRWMKTQLSGTAAYFIKLDSTISALSFLYQ
jgi:hypothetical protein